MKVFIEFNLLGITETAFSGLRREVFYPARWIASN